jgi:hypothetical protein
MAQHLASTLAQHASCALLPVVLAEQHLDFAAQQAAFGLQQLPLAAEAALAPAEAVARRRPSSETVLYNPVFPSI